MAINTQKAVTGGLAAGVVLAVLDFLINGVLFVEQNEAAAAALNPDLAVDPTGGQIAMFVALDIVLGLMIVWLYAAIRPRLGAGPKTAMIAGVFVWAVITLIFLFQTAMGLWEMSYTLTFSAIFLVVFLIVAYVGAAVYKEDDAPAAPATPSY
ncbi:MAG: hypothetical protein ABFS34_08650 [Gemmatimonadota bacterium]